jgi:hypothetical protein
MIRYTALLLFLCAFFAGAQSPEDPEVVKAKAETERLKELVAAGAAPVVQLAKAEEAMADAEDAAFLRKTLYGKDLSEAQSDEMVDAARRRLDRRQKAYEDAQRLVQLGAVGQLSVNRFRDDVDMARREFDLAQSRAQLTHEIALMAAEEMAIHARVAQSIGGTQRYDGDGVLSTIGFAKVERAFQAQFGKPLPVSALGETAVHRSMGFDHTGRVDVAVHPDSPEGAWLLEYLRAQRIPYYAFRQAVRGKATGAHIHIGPGSTRLANGG